MSAEITVNGFPYEPGIPTEHANLDVDTGTETVDTFSDTLCKGAYWDYVVSNGNNLRTGRVTASWAAATDTVQYSETSTPDVGDTSALTFTVDINSDLVRLRATATSDNWVVEAWRMELS